MMRTIFLLTLIFVSVVKAAEKESILFYVHGGAIKSYKSDKVHVDSKDNVLLETISPTFSGTPNLIGQFKLRLDKQQAGKMRNAIAKASKEIKLPKNLPGNSSIIEELHIGESKTFWTSQDNSGPIKTVRKEFLAIAREAYENPVKALSLHCEQKNGKINCEYKNVGREVVRTVDPLGVSYSLSCLDITGRKRILYKLKEHDPKKMIPEKIKIKPGERYSFSVQTDDICDYKVVVKTTDMLINQNYRDLLLGELVSNQLKK